VKGKALLLQQFCRRVDPESLGGVDEEAQGRAEGLWRRSAFFASFFVAMTKKEGMKVETMFNNNPIKGITPEH
jgi:hypothetical protein